MTIKIFIKAKAQPITVGIIMGKNKILDYGSGPGPMIPYLSL